METRSQASIKFRSSISEFEQGDIKDETSGMLNTSFIGNESFLIEPKEKPVRAIDVAVYILNSLGSCTSMKLHKLLYYCQAWSLVWDEAPLFSDRIEAWANGPVVKDVFSYHRGVFIVDADIFPTGNVDRLSSIQIDTIDSVLEFYGEKSAQWLINLTHAEDPWRNARKGLDSMERGNREITPASMAEYYSSL